MKQNTALCAIAATLLLTLSLSAMTGCQNPPEATPDTDGATLVDTDGETAATDTSSEETSAEETAPAGSDTEEATTRAEETTAAPDRELTVDGRYRIVISASADTLTRETADRVAELFLEKAGLELAIVTDAEVSLFSRLPISLPSLHPRSSVLRWRPTVRTPSTSVC